MGVPALFRWLSRKYPRNVTSAVSPVITVANVRENQRRGPTSLMLSRNLQRKPFIFLNASTLREYLAVELNMVETSFKFELKCAIEDWVLLIFFVGTDFLPHLPSLEIREGAIDCLLKIWKTNLASMGGYLTNCGPLRLSRTKIILEG
ncbi:hypothetical protein PPACK8108_LOCUS11349 [Phakopsora pachyrhizi]|uniref:Xrn1 helical domain-containing protein n=1 Tax=Phakopsora pachyrhizi TaxID=170000 RepID=A0AAV0B1N1_PHAPC|nr:hypothetical protein PPACK8108_LOCUS11349 [Phakopsora pachyrhizi]